MSDKVIADILRRLAALEKVIGGTHERPDRRLSKREVAEREATTPRTIDRRVRKGDFPSPEYIASRCYWWRSTLENHDAERIRRAEREIPKLTAARRKRMAVAQKARYAVAEAA